MALRLFETLKELHSLNNYSGSDNEKTAVRARQELIEQTLTDDEVELAELAYHQWALKQALLGNQLGEVPMTMTPTRLHRGPGYDTHVEYHYPMADDAVAILYRHDPLDPVPEQLAVYRRESRITIDYNRDMPLREEDKSKARDLIKLMMDLHKVWIHHEELLADSNAILPDEITELIREELEYNQKTAEGNNTLSKLRSRYEQELEPAAFRRITRYADVVTLCRVVVDSLDPEDGSLRTLPEILANSPCELLFEFCSTAILGSPHD